MGESPLWSRLKQLGQISLCISQLKLKPVTQPICGAHSNNTKVLSHESEKAHTLMKRNTRTVYNRDYFDQPGDRDYLQ